MAKDGLRVNDVSSEADLTGAYPMSARPKGAKSNNFEYPNFKWEMMDQQVSDLRESLLK